MPLFLRLVMGVGWLAGGAGALIIVIFLALAAGDIGPYTVNGAMVSKEEFMSFAVPLLGGYLALCLILLGTSLDLYRRRPRSRTLLLSMAIGSSLIGVGAAFLLGRPLGQVATAILLGGLLVASLWWYLFRDDAVVTYYDVLQARSNPTSPGS